MLQNDLYLKPYHACKYVHINHTARDHFKHWWSIYPTNGHLIPCIFSSNIINVCLLPWTIHVSIGEASDLTTVSCSHTGWSSVYAFRCLPEYMLRNEQSTCGCQHLHRVSPHMERVWTYYIDLFVCVPLYVWSFLPGDHLMLLSILLNTLNIPLFFPLLANPSPFLHNLSFLLNIIFFSNKEKKKMYQSFINWVC